MSVGKATASSALSFSLGTKSGMSPGGAGARPGAAAGDGDGDGLGVGSRLLGRRGVASGPERDGRGERQQQRPKE